MANQDASSEEWRVIPSFPGYEITRDGRVRDKYNQKEHSTKGNFVTLQVGAKRSTRSTRILALSAFSD